MASSSLPLSSYSLSGPLKALADNPLDFLKKNAIQFDTSIVPPEYISDDGKTFRSGTAGVKLVQSPTPTLYKLQFVAVKNMATDKEAVTAYVLGSTPNKGNDDVQFVDMPMRTYVEDTFMFTVDLSGCSVVATRLDGNTYRVFHDRRMDSAVLYKDVEMCVNFNDYRTGSFYLSRTGYAFICMQFKGGAWKMFLQRQLSDPADPKPIPEVHAYAVERKGPSGAESLEKAFNDRRTVLQKRLKSTGQNLKVDKKLIDDAKDGVVGGVVYDDKAIRGWEALRKAIKRQIDIDEKKGIDPSLKDTYVRFKNDVSASEDADETWIWLQVKKNKAKAKAQH